METYLVRLKRLDPKRGHVLRRYTYRGIKFQVDRGWYRVSKEVAEYLEQVRQVAADPHSPAAFDVCTEEAARARDAEEAREEKPTLATDAIKVAVARGEADAGVKSKRDDGKGRRAKSPGDAS